MRKQLLALAPLLVATLATLGQGTVTIANNAGTRVRIEAPDGLSSNLPPAIRINFGFFWGTNSNSLTLVPSLRTNATTPGLIAGPAVIAVPGAEPGQVVFGQVRGWSAEFGDDWEAAAHTYGGYFGETDIRPIVLGPTTGPGTVIWSSTDLTKFQSIVLRQVTVTSLYLTVIPWSGGSVTRSPDLISYETAAVVTVHATPDAGHAFIRWSGDATGSDNPLTVTMDGPKRITAIFASTAVTVNVDGLGSVAKNPQRGFYDLGQQVTLTAMSGRRRSFALWADGNTDNPRVITVGESNTYTAIFTPATPLETLTIGNVTREAPVGMPAVFVDGAFIVTESVNERGAATVALSTTFPGGTLLYTLDGSDPSLSARLYTGAFSVRKTSQLRAVAYNADFSQWVESDPIEIVILPTLTGVTQGGGSVLINPVSGAYLSNSIAQVRALPTPGWTFLEWQGDATGPSPLIDLSVTRNKVARAVFGTGLNTAVVGAGSIMVSPASPLYPYGSEVQLTAAPAPGNYFAFWANAASGLTQNPITFTVTNASPTVTAVFASLSGTLTNTLTVIPDGQGNVMVTPSGTRFLRNTNVTLRANPNMGQEFLGWSGDAGGSQNPLVIPMNTHKNITAHFTHRPWLRGEGTSESLREEGFRLVLTGKFGARYRIDGSRDLNDLNSWMDLGFVTNEWGTVQFTDGTARNEPLRLYRALELP